MIKKISSLFFAILFLNTYATECFSQYSVFQNFYGGYGPGNISSFQVSRSGGFVAAGSLCSNGTFDSSEVMLVKLDSAGGIQWKKNYGGNNIDDGESFLQLADGGFLIAGITKSFNQYFEVYLLKTDSLGNLYWSKTYNSSTYFPSSNFTAFLKIIETNDSCYLILCSLTVSSTYSFPIMLKIDNNGNLLWAKDYNLGGIFLGKSIGVTYDGGYYIIGNWDSLSSGNGSVACLVKTDSTGIVQWARKYAGSFNYNIGNGLQSTDHGYILSGSTGNYTIHSQDFLLIKTDPAGALQWSKTYGTSDDEGGIDVSKTADGGYAMSGATRIGGGFDKLCLVKTDSVGTFQWSAIYGNSSATKHGSDILVLDDGSYILYGTQSSVTPSPFVVKTDPTGNSGCYTNSFYLNETNVLTFDSSLSISDSVIFITVDTPLTVMKTLYFVEGVICFGTSTDIKDTDISKSVSINPNPFSDQLSLHFSIPQKEKAHITIFNSIGEIVFKKEILLQDQSLNLSSLPHGFYLLNIRTDREVFTEKIMN